MGGFDYPYGYEYDMGGYYTNLEDNFLGAIIVIYFLIILVSLAFSVVSYVLHSLGLYTIANRRKIRNSWLAWIPVGNLWVLGSVSDQFQYVAKGKVKNRRIQLVLLSVGLVALYIVWLICLVGMLFTGAMAAGFWLSTAAIAICPIVQLILEYIAYYDLYRSCEPDNSVLYLVLSIVFPVTLPFFVFFSRKKDGGMPPRKQTHIPRETEVVDTYPTEPVEAYPTEPVDAYPTEPVNAYPTEPVNAYPTEPVEEGFAQPADFEEE